MAFSFGLMLFSLAALAKTPGEAKQQAKDQKFAAAKADAAAVKLVELFLKMPTADLPVERIPDFMAVHPETLPKKLQPGYRAKREELLALKKIAGGRRKAVVRRVGLDAPPQSACQNDPPSMLSALRLAGYEDILEEDDIWLEHKTQCSECELMTEFTLRKVEKAQPKGKKIAGVKFIYLLHAKDPLLALVAARHAGVKNMFGTAFFGDGGFPRCH